MLSRIVNMVNTAFAPPATVRVSAKPNSNPFATTNPFVYQNTNQNPNYGKNKPVNGGYFAGYYNGKPNIVGRRLFIEA